MEVYLVLIGTSFEDPPFIESIWTRDFLAETRRKKLIEDLENGKRKFLYCSIMSKPLQGLHEDFLEIDREKVKTNLRNFIVEYFGEECEIFEEECFTCKAWKLFRDIETLMNLAY